MKRDYLGIALVVGVAALGAGGLVASFNSSGISDQAITAITALLATIAGGLIGYQVRKGGDSDEQ